MSRHAEPCLEAPPAAAAPASLFERVVDRIRLEERRLFFRRRALPGAIGAIASAVMAAWAVSGTLDQLSSGGAAAFLSLAYTDTDMVLAYGRDFLETALEALPVTGLIGVFSACFIGLLSYAALSSYEPRFQER
ncbi:hypothetical protein HY633_03185 [Candidatus Uhrbacteria bacterium]|nr:hypothetical protein [Candidatus Uhrbacteria bacterium]